MMESATPTVDQPQQRLVDAMEVDQEPIPSTSRVLSGSNSPVSSSPSSVGLSTNGLRPPSVGDDDREMADDDREMADVGDSDADEYASSESSEFDIDDLLEKGFEQGQSQQVKEPMPVPHEERKKVVLKSKCSLDR